MKVWWVDGKSKGSYIEDNHDGKAIEKIKKNTEEEVKEIIWELFDF